MVVDRRQRAHALPQHAADLAAGGIAGVQHAADAVRRLAAERRPAVGVAVEPRAPLEQLAHVRAGLLDERRGPPPRRTGRRRRESCRPRAAPAVVVADRRGDAALRVAGVAFGRFGLGEDEHAARRRQPDRRAQAGDAAADDDESPDLRRAHAGCYPTIRILMDSADPVRIDVPTPSRAYIGDARRRRARPPRRARSTTLGAPARRFVVSSPLVWRLHGAAARARGRASPSRSSCPTASASSSCRPCRASTTRWSARTPTARRRSSPSAAASSATWPASPPPPTCAASRSCTCRRRCWRRSTARSAARSASTTRSARI